MRLSDVVMLQAACRFVGVDEKQGNLNYVIVSGELGKLTDGYPDSHCKPRA
jgi:hypothetical protein